MQWIDVCVIVCVLPKAMEVNNEKVETNEEGCKIECKQCVVMPKQRECVRPCLQAWEEEETCVYQNDNESQFCWSQFGKGQLELVLEMGIYHHKHIEH